ncbi:MAG: sensor histidine kinase [Lachnospiraceae bacterium]|nr:sensor histidine kinase [Lachnospiraceae bacterium]
MKKRKYTISRFISFFLAMSFVVTCSMFLFLHFLDFSEEQIRTAAPLTIGNVIFLTILFCVIDHIRYTYMVERPVQSISEGISRVMEGDLSVRIPEVRSIGVFDEYEEIVRELNKLFAELSSVETLRTDFISNVSHELKTPLSVIQNYGTMLQTPHLSEEKRMEYSKKITEQTRRLSAMVTNILRLNKLENQQIFPNREKLNLSEHICEHILEFEPLWEEKGLAIETRLEEGVEILGDTEMLGLVWSNLMSNAIKFTESGGKITITVAASDGKASVEFRDTGCGISPETGKRIFQRFYQGDTSHASQGNGLGLALVKRIIDIHGGDIVVNSELGKGSTFRVEFERK